MQFQVRRFDSLDSTNRYLLDEARAGAPEGLVAVADYQTAGRGRRGRSWVAPPGVSLLVSVLVRPSLAPDRGQLVSIAAGMAMADAVERVAGFAPALKWPNDLLVEDKKLAGLLAEADGDAVVVGIGVNVEWHDFPPEVAETATACNLVAGRPVERDQVLEVFLEQFATRYEDLDHVLAEYRARLATLGRRVRVETATGALTGTAADVGEAGELLVDQDGGGRVAVHAGDVVHLRDA
ncbi:MAG TPA: biotin--[acetyl-CoA-carboxylase] ligase [Acidimicrobiia bacterium]|nr:biotin--[acetyl-CoA-carboxylase] ligase [Acidimicrobiia bacterium]